MTAEKGKPQALGRFSIIMALAVGVAFAAVSFFQGRDDRPPAPGDGSGLEKLVFYEQPKTLPRIVALDGNGKPRALSEWKGKVLLVNFWATWCPPCRKEMPDIIALQKAYQGRDFDVIAISEDYKGYDWAFRTLQKMGGENLTLLWDKGGAALKAVGVQGLPVTLLVDRQGREAARLIGPAKWNSPQARAVIDRLLAEK